MSYLLVCFDLTMLNMLNRNRKMQFDRRKKFLFLVSESCSHVCICSVFVLKMKQNNLLIENHLSQYPKLVQDLRSQVLMLSEQVYNCFHCLWHRSFWPRCSLLTMITLLLSSDQIEKEQSLRKCYFNICCGFFELFTQGVWLNVWCCSYTRLVKWSSKLAKSCVVHFSAVFS